MINNDVLSVEDLFVKFDSFNRTKRVVKSDFVPQTVEDLVGHIYEEE